MSVIEKQPENVSVVVVTHSSRDCPFTAKAAGVEQLILMSEAPDPQLETQNVTQVHCPAGLGIAVPWNLGAGSASAELVLFWDDRYRLSEDGLAQMVSALREDPDAGAIGPASSGAGSAFGSSRETDRPEPAGILVRRELLEKIGGFDPAIVSGPYLLQDFAMRATLAGYRVLQSSIATTTPQVVVEETEEETLHRWEAFAHKWVLPEGRDPHESWSSRDIEGIPFNRAAHYVPLTVSTLPIVEQTRYTFLTVVDPVDDAWQSHVQSYVEAFEADDEVTMLLRVPDLEQTDTVIEKVREIAAQRGIRFEDVPDLLLLDLPFRPGEQASLFATAHAVLTDENGGNDEHLRLADMTGRPVIQEVSPSSLRAALNRGA